MKQVLTALAAAPAEVQEQAKEMIVMAMAEAGYPLEPFFDGRKWRYPADSNFPLDVLNRARVIVSEALGYEWTWTDENGCAPDGWADEQRRRVAARLGAFS